MRIRDVAACMMTGLGALTCVYSASGLAAGPEHASYNFSVVATLGDPAPAGGAFVNDFEPGGLNNHGDMAFGADVTTGGEGVFFRHNGQFTSSGAATSPRRAGEHSSSDSLARSI